jgi:hypothetical protein
MGHFLCYNDTKGVAIYVGIYVQRKYAKCHMIRSSQSNGYEVYSSREWHESFYLEHCGSVFSETSASIRNSIWRYITKYDNIFALFTVVTGLQF